MHGKRGEPRKKRAISTEKSIGGIEMYRKKDKKTQELFKELMPWGGKLNENNRWLRLQELVPCP